VEIAATRDPSETVEDEPVPTLAVSPSPVPAEEIEAAPVLAEDPEASRASAEGVVAAAVPAEKVDPTSPAAAPPANFLPESIGTSEETKKQREPFAQKETTEESDALPALELSRQRQPIALSIRPGDTLTAIIIQHYGSYNKETLGAVLHENPEIQNPDRIFAGEILKLPMPFEKP
jgi:nucleoid-associated protein YgaU